MKINRRDAIGAFGAVALLSNSPVHAAENGILTIVVPFPPGGTTDLLGRVVSQELGTRLKRTVIVENKPGAGGGLGAGYVGKAKPDGLTLLMATVGTQSINPSLYKTLSYSRQDFAPISRVGNVSNVLVVNSSLPIKSLADLIQYAKENPRKLTFGSAGNGSSMHLTGELFKRRSGILMDHVPYRGSGPAMNDLMAGHISMIFENLSTALPHITAGKVRAIAVTSIGRAQALPDLPTIAESGLHDFNATSWFGLLLPAGASESTVMATHKEIRDIVATPAVRQRLLSFGVEPFADTSPAAFQEVIDADTKKWAAVIKDANVQMD